VQSILSKSVAIVLLNGRRLLLSKFDPDKPKIKDANQNAVQPWEVKVNGRKFVAIAIDPDKGIQFQDPSSNASAWIK
jgi:hypothetical protein